LHQVAGYREHAGRSERELRDNMSETQASPETETSSEESKSEGEKKTNYKITSIKEGYETTAKYYRGIDSPSTAEGVLAELESQFNDILSCDCKLCAIRAAQTCETYVIISEVLKLVSPDCENGVAGLIFRLHESRMRAVGMTLTAGMEKLLGGSGAVGVGAITGEDLMKVFEGVLVKSDGGEKTEAEESSEPQE